MKRFMKGELGFLLLAVALAACGKQGASTGGSLVGTSWKGDFLEFAENNFQHQYDFNKDSITLHFRCNVGGQSEYDVVTAPAVITANTVTIPEERHGTGSPSCHIYLKANEFKYEMSGSKLILTKGSERVSLTRVQ